MENKTSSLDNIGKYQSEKSSYTDIEDTDLSKSSYVTSTTNSQFVERFNNDPLFAFDSLLEIFYNTWKRFEPKHQQNLIGKNGSIRREGGEK